MGNAPDWHRDYRRALRSVGPELAVDAWVGAIAGGLFTCAIDQSPLSVLLRVAGCGLVGSPFGVLLWLGSANLPEKAIPPVRTSTRSRDG
jgi:hypothetical protein